MKKNVLICYISKYSGHFHAAEAIEKGLAEVWGDVNVKKIDALEYTNPILGKVINKAYLEVIKKKPQLWGEMYDNPSVMKKTAKAREALNRSNLTKIKKLFDEFSPDAVFCTQAFPCSMIADYKRAYGKKTLLVGVLTDYAPHSYWLFDEVDYYVMPSEETAKVFTERGVPGEKIKLYGIPIDPGIRIEKERDKIRENLNFSAEKPTILVMGGSQGLGSVEDVVGSLLQDTEHNYQLLVVSGTNKKLCSRLTKIARSEIGRNMRVFSYVENVDELMEISDVIITKAGGLTTAEALAKRLPILIVSPIPGHERMNTDFLVKNGAAIEISVFLDTHKILNELFDSEDRMKKMRACAEVLSKPNSAVDTAKLTRRDC